MYIIKQFIMDTKKCKKCGKELPASEFYKNKACNDGLSSWCKECMKENSKQRYEENKEEIIKKIKQYYHDNKKTILEYHKKYSEKNKEKLNKYSKQYYCGKKENILEYYKKRRLTLEGYCRSIRNSNINEDRKYGRIGEELPNNYPTIEDYMVFLQLPDFYDGKQYHFTEMGIDRIDNNKPHTLDNIVPCSTKNNKKRGKKYTCEQFMKLMM